LAHEGGPLVEELRDLCQRDSFDDPIAPERRGRHVDVDGDVRTRWHRYLVRSGRLGAGAYLDPPFPGCGQGSALLAPLDRHQRVHQPQTLEGVAGVTDLAGEDLTQVLLDVGTGQCGAAEEDRIAGARPSRIEPWRFSSSPPLT
jgi:hypothetical protein